MSDISSLPLFLLFFLLFNFMQLPIAGPKLSSPLYLEQYHLGQTKAWQMAMARVMQYFGATATDKKIQQKSANAL